MWLMQGTHQSVHWLKRPDMNLWIDECNKCINEMKDWIEKLPGWVIGSEWIREMNENDWID